MDTKGAKTVSLRSIEYYYKKPISIGDIIKISTPGERFWCIVKALKGDDFVCEIDNDISSESGAKRGDYILVKRENIYGKYLKNGGYDAPKGDNTGKITSGRNPLLNYMKRV